MRIAILDLTEPMPGVLDDIPRVSKTITAWLGPALPMARFLAFDIVSGQDFPVLDTVDGVIVSGSDHGVYDNLPWMQPLRNFLQAAKAARKPMFGICFGHQILADVFGGKAEKANVGLNVGMREFEIEGQSVPTHVWHKDQVTEVPEGATIWAKSEYCPVGALSYDFPALSVQFHPEYSRALMFAVMERAIGHFSTPEMMVEAGASFAKGEAEPDLVAERVATFFRDHLGL